ncbi:oxygenase MpaB family protein [Gordonia sp. LSe1-13]|uniref:Oxygenase MpaB family protein n=1 Tax=Gordonia sesuvii TaxID=3116777 RepID=A0ABU7MEN2_9ACTN|nr:oxygenase MpaB family protein [Gordonia sp. LSe1-13]
MESMPKDLCNADLAVARYGPVGERWLSEMWVGDELADAVVNDTFPGSSSTEAVRIALEHGIGAVDHAPESLRELFAFLDDEPEWVDHARLDRAADALIRHTAALGVVLAAASLLRGAGNSIAGKPLVQTGRYASMPAVRSVEVGEWLRHVITPGGMRRDGAGFAYTVRVRMIHAHVRRGLYRAGIWDEAAWGVPIPQPYMAFTMAEFGHIALDAMRSLGVRLSNDDLDAIYHLWRYVGHVIGMGELNPTDAADHIRIEELYRLTSPGPDDHDREFVVALTDDYLIPELANTFPGPDAARHKVASTLVHGLQRVFLGDADAEALHIPDTRLKYVIRAAGPALAGLGHLRMVVGGGPQRISRRGYRVRDAEMARMRAAYDVTHQLVDDAPVASASV